MTQEMLQRNEELEMQPQMNKKKKKSCKVEVKVNDNGSENCTQKIRLVSSTCLSVMQDESAGKMEKKCEKGIIWELTAVFRPGSDPREKVKSGEDRCI